MTKRIIKGLAALAAGPGQRRPGRPRRRAGEPQRGLPVRGRRVGDRGAPGLFVRDRLEADLDRALGASLNAQAADVAALAQQADSGLAEAQGAPGIQQAPLLAQVIDARGRAAGAPRRPLLDAAALARARGASVAVARTLVAGRPVRLLAVPIRAQDEQRVAVVGQWLEQRDRAIADLTGVLLVGGPAALALAAGAFAWAATVASLAALLGPAGAALMAAAGLALGGVTLAAGWWSHRRSLSRAVTGERAS